MDVTVFNTFNAQRGTIDLKVQPPSGAPVSIPNGKSKQFPISQSQHLTVNVISKNSPSPDNYSVYVKDQPKGNSPTFKVQVSGLNGTNHQITVTDLQSSTAPAVSVGDDEQ